MTIFWIIGFTNTVNLIDGLDGLAAGVAFIASISMFLLAYNLNQFLPALVIVSMAGAALGFLQYNFNPAKIFMGDTGSMLLGYTLSVAAVLGLVKTQPPWLSSYPSSPWVCRSSIRRLLSSAAR